MVSQLIVFSILFLALVLFVWGKWRYDIVALLALLAVTVTGIIPAGQAFSGFGHPAVITVAAVLVVSRGLLNAGVVNVLARQLSRVGDRPISQIAALTTLVAILSGFMNNVGALESIDWPIIVLLAAMIPVGEALEVTGGAGLIANQVLAIAGWMSPLVTLAIVLVATMFLSDLVNNAAAAVLMAPIAITIAQGLGASADPFLMAVAIGASCAFLTPIGHQSNTLVMGPGGYHFGDYWRMGLLLEIVAIVVALPLIAWFWPL